MTGEIPALRRARAAADKVKAEIADRRSRLTLAKPTDEQRKDHEEIRAAMRAMSPEQRDAFLKENRQNPVAVAAIANAVLPALVGLDALVHQNIISEQIEREHGETIAEIADLEEVARVVDHVTGLARDELARSLAAVVRFSRMLPASVRPVTVNCLSESSSARSTARRERFAAYTTWRCVPGGTRLRMKFRRLPRDGLA
jgi:hypothetical protein